MIVDSLTTVTNFNMLEIEYFNKSELIELLIRFMFNFLVSGFIVKYLYLPNSKNKEYLFTYMILSTSIFLLIFLLESVKIKVGFALGLFAIFGILRYRTSQIPIKEMTYLFVFICLAVINGMTSKRLNYSEIVSANLLMICVTFLLEKFWVSRLESIKEINYEKIDLILPDRRLELLEDLRKRTGLDINRIDIGKIDFLKDTAKISVYYNESKTNSK